MAGYILTSEFVFTVDPLPDELDDGLQPETQTINMAGLGLNGDQQIPYAVSASKAFDVPWDKSDLDDLVNAALLQITS